MSSCSAKKGLVKNENGSYAYELKKSSSLNEPVIYGSLFDFNSGETLKIGHVRVDTEILNKADTNGNFMFSVKPGRHRFRGIDVLYQQVKTKVFKVSKGDSLKIIFNLKLFDKPLID